MQQRIMGSPISHPPAIGRTKYCVPPPHSVSSMPGRRRPCALGSRSMVAPKCAPVTHQDQGRHGVLFQPLAAVAAPENPLFPIASNSGEQCSHKSVVSPRFFPWRPNPGWLAIRAQLRLARAGPVAACNQVLWLCQPLCGTAATPPLIIIRKRVPRRRALRSS